MKQWALIKENIVVNVIVMDEGVDYPAPDGITLVQNDSCGIGDIYDPVAQTFSKPEAA